jgi:superfamily II DNA/RNA helicase
MRRATSVLAVLPLVRGYTAALPASRVVRRFATVRPAVPPRGSRTMKAAAEEDDADGSFDALGLSPHLLAGLHAMGIDEPTEIQRLSWPVIRSGSDAVLLDETGTGKTLAYVLPILQAVIEERESLMAEALQAAEAATDARDAPTAAAAPATGNRRLTFPRMPSQALFLSPNRELVVQVHETVSRLLAHVPASYGIRASALTESDANGDLDVLVATPAIAQRS